LSVPATFSSLGCEATAFSSQGKPVSQLPFISCQLNALGRRDSWKSIFISKPNIWPFFCRSSRTIARQSLLLHNHTLPLFVAWSIQLTLVSFTACLRVRPDPSLIHKTLDQSPPSTSPSLTNASIVLLQALLGSRRQDDYNGILRHNLPLTFNTLTTCFRICVSETSTVSAGRLAAAVSVTYISVNLFRRREVKHKTSNDIRDEHYLWRRDCHQVGERQGQAPSA